MTGPTNLEDRLYASWVDGILISPPAECFSLEEAYDAQRRIFEMRGDGLVGWKLAATSEIAQERMGLSNPVAGRLAAADVLQTGEDVEAPPGALYAEAELAVMLRSDLPARDQAYDSSDIAAAIGPVYAAIEMCASRYADDEVEAPALVADNAFAYRLVLGRMLAPSWDAKFAATPVTLDLGEGRCVQGSTAAVMGNPLKAVVWLANWLASQGEWLKRGQVIATGSCTGISEVHVGETLRASFGGVEGAPVTIVPRGKS